MNYEADVHPRALWAWGANQCGQLGEGSEDAQPAPVTIEGVRNVIHVAAGYRSALAVDAAGHVWAWGENEFGKLGDGTEQHRPAPVRLLSLSGVTMVAAGARTSYALTDDGSVWAWGGNPFHELGGGERVDHMAGLRRPGGLDIRPLSPTESGRKTPDLVRGLSRVISIAAGGSRAFALRSDGTVWAWGDNQRGRLGDGTILEHSIPIRLTALSEVTSIAVGERSAYALRADGTVWAWGDNSAGQLGVGSLTGRLTPVRVQGLDDVVAVAAGGATAYALDLEGALWAWGDNGHGQIGDGTQVDRTTPVRVIGLPEVAKVSAGANWAYAITASGDVWAWGSNEAGQLPGFDGLDSLAPTHLSVARGVVSIFAGRDASYALTDATRGDSGFTVSKQLNREASEKMADTPPGSVWAWGRNDVGQLGDGSRSNTGGPVQVAELDEVIQLSLDRHSGFDEDGLIRALRSDGTVWAWGGVYMNGTVQGLRVPTQVEGIPPITALADFFALDEDGTVWDLRSSRFHSEPDPIKGISEATAIYSFKPLLYTVTRDQRLWVFEKSFYDWEQTGDYYWDDPGRILEGPTAITAMASWWLGEIRSELALTSGGEVWFWQARNLGANVPNQMMAEFAVDGRPMLVPRLSGVASIGNGNSCGYALKADGTLWAWGDNESGQLGNGATQGSSTPVLVNGLENIVAIDPHADSCLALADSGIVWAWGANIHGELGSDPCAFSPIPVRVSGLEDVKALRAGFAIKGDGSVWAWGRNENGRLADEASADRATPLPIPGLSDVVEIIHAPRPGYGESWYAITGGPTRS